MWGMKTDTIPVAIGALGLSKKGLQNTRKKSLERSTSVGYKKQLYEELPTYYGSFVSKAKFVIPVMP